MYCFLTYRFVTHTVLQYVLLTFNVASNKVNLEVFSAIFLCSSVHTCTFYLVKAVVKADPIIYHYISDCILRWGGGVPSG